MEEHRAAVKATAAQVQGFHRRKEPFRIYHGSTNSTRIVQFERDKMLDMSHFTHVLHVDTERQTALVEPNVAMDALVAATLPHGLVPPVVMEFPGITVGGGFAGVAGESSSWRHGFFDRTVNWCDVVLATGETARASPTENADLFYGAPGTYGTLCVTTLFELRLVPARRFVELEYRVVDSVGGAVAAIEAAIAAGDHNYIDGILFSATRGAIMLGRLVDTPSSPGTKTLRFTRPWDNWFYLHASSVTKRAGKQQQQQQEATKSDAQPQLPSHTELIPLQDYLFRYDRGAFWTGRYAFHRFHTPFDRVSRALLDPLMHTRRMYAALNASGFAQQYVIQDLALPMRSAEAFVRWVEEHMGVWPLWLCPLRIEDEAAVPLRARVGVGAAKNTSTSTSTDASASASSSPSPYPPSSPTPTPPYTLLNIGLWGPGPPTHAPFIALNRQLETCVHALGGFKWLYANAYYTEAEFWAVYDRAWYEGLRRKYGAEGLPGVYEKVRAREGRVRVSGMRGVWEAVAGGRGAHLLEKGRGKGRGKGKGGK
ncbi:uncharacterized protein K452DRAFT_356552 [Aplosporella prunicola CBS 121167]|uniref:Delta(24)-sterol reductase n=1 Tax=Aplosporella prunicola CBS 121167 TaxID=1176127 RepID=A0A6A6BMC4_9PEZI|nr:uncharacterized protein K452DRAFT_356552 [Aplosporella prunicola CBS 121167]KAF2145279.1 hypothetical protein K452DRAFT_356552 [Aplosporella prunicola CBS 121167]